jgi:hypothetical protein
VPAKTAAVIALLFSRDWRLVCERHGEMGTRAHHSLHRPRRYRIHAEGVAESRKQSTERECRDDQCNDCFQQAEAGVERLAGSSTTPRTIPHQDVRSGVFPEHGAPSGFAFGRVGVGSEVCDQLKEFR